MLLWDVDPSEMDADRHEARIFERVMTRGTLEAMRWLLAAYDEERLRAFVRTAGARILPPREFAFWSTILELDPPAPGSRPPATGGRPVWAD